ncbi:MAG TPA: apolipoprotein N-acyltransferase [Firmicutes bacterium]|nr:apolipoprotein N-acyltransferase [Bacillota bacterium]
MHFSERQIYDYRSGRYSYLISSLLSGLLLIGAYPPFEQGYLAWFALLPMLNASLRETPLRAFWVGLVFGLPVNLYLNYYLGHVLFPYLPFPLALAAMIALVLYISFFNGLFSLAASMISRYSKVWLIALALPTLWVLVEYLRSAGFMAYNVGYLGYSQWNYQPLLNITSVYGYWGLPFIIVLFQSLLILYPQRKSARANYYPVVMVFIILISCGLILPSTFTVDEGDSPIAAALVQGNSSQEEIIERGRETVVRRYISLTEAALDEAPDIELAVWPETVLEMHINGISEHLEPLRLMADNLGVMLLYGARIYDGENLYNAVSLIKSGSEEFSTYYKHRLVPFVEYFPFEQLLNRILDLELLLGRYTAGEDITIFNINGTPVGAVICFESYFGDHTRHFSAAGSRHLFVLTNDNWFGKSIGLDLHAQAAAVRAAEMGIGVTQVANSGITISFDYCGREIFRTGKQEETVITAQLDTTRRNTIYTRYGDYFPAVWAIFLAASLTAVKLSRARKAELVEKEKPLSRRKRP